MNNSKRHLETKAIGLAPAVNRAVPPPMSPPMNALATQYISNNPPPPAQSSAAAGLLFPPSMNAFFPAPPSRPGFVLPAAGVAAAHPQQNVGVTQRMRPTTQAAGSCAAANTPGSMTVPNAAVHASSPAGVLLPSNICPPGFLPATAGASVTLQQGALLNPGAAAASLYAARHTAAVNLAAAAAAENVANVLKMHQQQHIHRAGMQNAAAPPPPSEPATAAGERNTNHERKSVSAKPAPALSSLSFPLAHGDRNLAGEQQQGQHHTNKGHLSSHSVPWNSRSCNRRDQSLPHTSSSINADAEQHSSSRRGNGGRSSHSRDYRQNDHAQVNGREATGRVSSRILGVPEKDPLESNSLQKEEHHQQENESSSWWTVSRNSGSSGISRAGENISRSYKPPTRTTKEQRSPSLLARGDKTDQDSSRLQGDDCGAGKYNRDELCWSRGKNPYINDGSCERFFETKDCSSASSGNDRVSGRQPCSDQPSQETQRGISGSRQQHKQHVQEEQQQHHKTQSHELGYKDFSSGRGAWQLNRRASTIKAPSVCTRSSGEKRWKERVKEEDTLKRKKQRLRPENVGGRLSRSNSREASVSSERSRRRRSSPSIQRPTNAELEPQRSRSSSIASLPSEAEKSPNSCCPATAPASESARAMEADETEMACSNSSISLDRESSPSPSRQQDTDDGHRSSISPSPSPGRENISTEATTAEFSRSRAALAGTNSSGGVRHCGQRQRSDERWAQKKSCANPPAEHDSGNGRLPSSTQGSWRKSISHDRYRQSPTLSSCAVAAPAAAPADSATLRHGRHPQPPPPRAAEWSSQRRDGAVSGGMTCSSPGSSSSGGLQGARESSARGPLFDLWVPTTFHPLCPERVRLVLGPKGRTHKEMELLAKTRVQLYGKELIRDTSKHEYDLFRDKQPLHLVVGDKIRKSEWNEASIEEIKDKIRVFLEQLVERTWPKNEQRAPVSFYDKQLHEGPSSGPLVYVDALGIWDTPVSKDVQPCIVYKPEDFGLSKSIANGGAKAAGRPVSRDNNFPEKAYEGDVSLLLNCTPPLCLLLLTLQALHGLLLQDGAQELGVLPLVFERKWEIRFLFRREEFQAVAPLSVAEPQATAQSQVPAYSPEGRLSDDAVAVLVKFIKEFPEVFDVVEESADAVLKGNLNLKVKAREHPDFARVAYRFKSTDPWLQGNLKLQQQPLSQPPYSPLG